MKFQSIVASVLTIACSFCVLTSQAAAAKIPTVNVSELKDFVSGEPKIINATLSMNESFDVGNNTLIIKGIQGSSGITGSNSFTGADDGIVDLEFASNVSMSGSATFFTGGIQLVVRGDYTIRLPKTSSHTGGTVVCGGVVDGVTGTTRTLNSMKPFGAAGSVLEIQGGTVLSHAYNTWQGNYSILLKGGCLKNDAAYSGSNVFDASIEVAADSTIDATSAIPFKPGSISGAGKLTLTGEGGFTIKKDISMPETSLSVASSFALGSYDLEVADYEVTAETAPTGTGTIKVNGTFKPQTENFCSVILQNGASIDLTSWEEKAVVNAGGNQVAFAEAATITLDVGNREVKNGDIVLIWAEGTEAAAYEGRLFKLVGQNVASDLAVEATADGIKAVQAGQDIVTAVWKGEGDVNNWEDSANWVCYNAADAVIENGVPGEDLTVVFTDDVSGVPFTNDFPFAGARLTDATLSANVDWSAFDLGLITQDSVLDIGENTIKIARESGITSCAATFTSTAEGGVFEIEVAEGESFTNATINLSGAISLKKTGLGALVLTKEGQSYTGKTMVEEGTLVCGTANVTTAKTFGEGKEIDLANGAILDPAGTIYWNDVVINVNGGMISNTVERTGLSNDKYNATIANPFSPILNLNVSSILATSESFNFQGKVNAVNDSELTIYIPAGKEFLWDASDAKDVKLNVTGGGFFKVWYKTTKKYADIGGPILDMQNASFDLQFTTASTGAKYPATFGVEDYIASSETGTHMNGGTLEVYRTFVPVNDYFFGCKMMDGSTIDLSSKETNEVWSITSSATGKNTIEFEEGDSSAPTQITINLGTRKFEPGEKVIEWTSKPINVAFTFTSNGDPVDVKARALVDGLYYGQEIITRAEWTGEAGNGDLSDSKNWKDEILPTGEIQAKFTGDISKIVAPAEDTFACSEFYFENAELTQTADFSWIDLNKITDDSVIDIKGQKLKIASTNSISTTSATITDSVGGGTVEFTVGEGVVHTNAALAFEGGLKFVKKGGGIYVAAKYPQLYTNVTEVVEGGIRCEDGANMNATDKKSPFGESFIVMLDEGTFLDPAGSYLWGYHTIEMNGGIISNTVAQSGVAKNYTSFSTTKFDYPFNPKIILNKDASLISPVNFNFKGTIEGTGRTLTVNSKETRWASSGSTGATVVFTGNTVVKSLKNFPMNEPNMTMVMDGATFDIGGNMTISNYTANSESAISTYRGSMDDNWSLTVYGTFRPETSDFLGCVMQNGSTLDLSAQNEAFNLYNPQGQTNVVAGVTPWLCQYVTFANDATITIDVYGRDFAGKKNKQIVSWTEKPENHDTLTFVLDAESKQAGYKLNWTEEGIIAEHLGMLLMLK